MNERIATRRVRARLLNVCRALLVAGIVLLIHRHADLARGIGSDQAVDFTLQDVQVFLPSAAALKPDRYDPSVHSVLDVSGTMLGTALQTSPAGDAIIGFSGPTNVLVVLTVEGRIGGMKILASQDTREHVRQVAENRDFLQSFVGMTSSQAARPRHVDAVSGATLTSMAIQEAVVRRLGGEPVSLRFPEGITLEQARTLFPAAETLERDHSRWSIWHAADREGRALGTLLRGSPATDSIIGYQGPSDVWIGLDTTQRIVGAVMAETYDNEPYVRYVREDGDFLSRFKGLYLAELARMDLKQAEVEGVSGATMTSMAVARAMVAAAEAAAADDRSAGPRAGWGFRDTATAAVVVAALAMGWAPLAARRPLRWVFLGVRIGYLGLISGDLISQAMLVGWARHGVAWQSAGGLVVLTAAAFAVPLASGRNIYCSRLCPHGAAQQLLRNRGPIALRSSRRVAAWLKCIPVALLCWSVVVAMTGWPFSLVAIEPFDAWVFRVAGWATISVAVVGLAASLVVPMAYCRYGCPTGALIGYVRYRGPGDRLTRRDGVAIFLLVLAVALHVNALWRT